MYCINIYIYITMYGIYIYVYVCKIKKVCMILKTYVHTTMYTHNI